MCEDSSLALGDALSGLGNLRGDFGWHEQDAMFISVQQGPRVDRHAPHFDWRTKINQMHIGMGDTDATREKMKTDRSDFIEVPDVSIGDDAAATEPAVDCGLDLPEIGAGPGGIVQIFENQDPGLGDLQKKIPKIEPWGGALCGLVRGEARRDSIADHHA